MSSEGRVVSVNISTDKHEKKKPVPDIRIDGSGIVGDAHAGPWHRQVSLLAEEDIDVFAAQMGREIAPGEFAENITLADVDLAGVSPFDRFAIGQVELEVTQIGKKCHGNACAIQQEIGKCVMPDKGLFCRVITGGTVKPGDSVRHINRPLRLLIVTLSDRAYAGQYTDRAGPAAREILADHFASTRWHPQIEAVILPDEAGQLRKELQKALKSGVHVVFTLGSTGIGPRDIAPEVVADVCEKIIPGIMEYVRVKYGTEIPSALLSRSVAGLAGTTQIYSLPGSVRAVEQYMQEILKILEHAIYMVHGLDIH